MTGNLPDLLHAARHAAGGTDPISGLGPPLGFTTGWYYGMPDHFNNLPSQTYAAGHMVVYPFWLPSAVTISKLIHRVDGSGTGTAGCLVVYGDNGYSYPGTLQAYATAGYSTGNIDSTVNGSTAVIGPGLVWLGEYVSAGSAAPTISSASINDGGGSRYVAAAGFRYNLYTAIGFDASSVSGSTPPSTYPSGADVTSAVPLVQFAV